MDRQRSQQFMQKLVEDVATALAVSVLFVAERSRLLAAMAGAGPLSGAELAACTGIPVRCAEESLAALAASGYVEHDPATDRFALPEEHAAFLVDPSSEYYMGGLVEGQLTTAATTPRLAQAYARGEGLPFAAFGPELAGVLERMNRSAYQHRLVRSWLPALPEVVARLHDGGRAIDVGCGTGIVPITLAASFPPPVLRGSISGSGPSPRRRSTPPPRVWRWSSSRRRWMPCRSIRPNLAGPATPGRAKQRGFQWH